MSYEIVKGLKIDNKNKKVFLRSSSNNIYPKSYDRFEYMKNSDDFENKKFSLFYGILGGYLNLRICDNINWKYASYKFFDYCTENNIDTYDLWELGRDKDGFNNLKQYYDIFMSYVDEKKKGLYYLDSTSGYITNITHRGFFYTNDLSKMKNYNYNYKKAYINMKRLSDDTIKKYNINLVEYVNIKDNDCELEC